MCKFVKGRKTKGKVTLFSTWVSSWEVLNQIINFFGLNQNITKVERYVSVVHPRHSIRSLSRFSIVIIFKIKNSNDRSPKRQLFVARMWEILFFVPKKTRKTREKHKKNTRKTHLPKYGCLHSMGVFSSSVSSPLFKTWCTAVQWSNKEILPIPAPSTSFLFFSLLSPGTYRGELILHFKKKDKK